MHFLLVRRLRLTSVEYAVSYFIFKWAILNCMMTKRLRFVNIWLRYELNIIIIVCEVVLISMFIVVLFTQMTETFCCYYEFRQKNCLAQVRFANLPVLSCIKEFSHLTPFIDFPDLHLRLHDSVHAE